jgi:hypothetical protein
MINIYRKDHEGIDFYISYSQRFDDAIIAKEIVDHAVEHKLTEAVFSKMKAGAAFELRKPGGSRDVSLENIWEKLDNFQQVLRILPPMGHVSQSRKEPIQSVESVQPRPTKRSILI